MLFGWRKYVSSDAGHATFRNPFFFLLVTSVFVYRDYILDCTLMEFMVDESLDVSY